MSKSVLPWVDALAFGLFLYVLFHVQPIIAFLDRLIAR